MNLASTNGSIEIFSKIKELGPEAFEGIKTFCANGEAVFTEIQRINEVPANFFVGPINFGLTPNFDLFSSVNGWLLMLPVLTFVVYFATMKINRKFTFQPTQNADDRQQACSNNMMDITMPLMSVWMTFIVPAAVGVYWIFKSIIGVVKQFIMSKAMPLPTFTEEDYKAAAKELAGKKTVKKSSNAGKVRSLHYIDDEDFEDTRERGLARRAAIEEREREEQEAKAQKTPFGAARLKEDRKAEEKKAEEDTTEATDAEESVAQENDNNKDEV